MPDTNDHRARVALVTCVHTFLDPYTPCTYLSPWPNQARDDALEIGDDIRLDFGLRRIVVNGEIYYRSAVEAVLGGGCMCSDSVR
jgi:hypothetical protein